MRETATRDSSEWYCFHSTMEDTHDDDKKRGTALFRYESDDDSALDMIRAHYRESCILRLQEEHPLDMPWLRAAAQCVAEHESDAESDARLRLHLRSPRVAWHVQFDPMHWQELRWRCERREWCEGEEVTTVLAAFTWHAPVGPPYFPNAPPRMIWHGPRYDWKHMLALLFIEAFFPSQWNMCQDLDQIRAQIQAYVAPLTICAAQFQSQWYEDVLLHFVRHTGIYPSVIRSALPSGVHRAEENTAGIGFSRPSLSPRRDHDTCSPPHRARLECLLTELVSALDPTCTAIAAGPGRKLADDEVTPCLLAVEQTGVYAYAARAVPGFSAQDISESQRFLACLLQLATVHRARRPQMSLPPSIDAMYQSIALVWARTRALVDVTPCTALVDAALNHYRQRDADRMHHQRRIVTDDALAQPSHNTEMTMTANDRLRQELGVPMYRAHMQSMRLLTVDALATHAFASATTTTMSSSGPPPLSPACMRRLRREWHDFESSLVFDGLAGNIFVRWQMPAQPRLWRLIIVPPLATPYAGGWFVFDMEIPHTYPETAPVMKFLTTDRNTLRFNPNLYASGKVCLSLLGTWQGEPWCPAVSNLNQVFLSIFAMIFVEDPFFNEPGYQSMKGTEEGAHRAQRYRANVRYLTLRHAVHDVIHDAVRGVGEDATAALTHFRTLWPALSTEYQTWIEDETDAERCAEMEKWLCACTACFADSDDTTATV